ncbi:MAG: NapC/NirT family cytochrome c [Gammaproteobacteria bacterium]|nr:NapC/NirT family cytochrome c [Gammaproteobacteria bacterium]MCP5138194.1 NapC/NirT family cytochrome c [Gammaproteobacteria bacterium]
MRRDLFEREPRRSAWGGLLLILVGIGLALGVDYGVKQSNADTFCTSCHSMQWVAAEAGHGGHAHNPSGVTARCADCHVPRDPGPLLWNKLMAARSLLAEYRGELETEAQFEAHRFDLAETVWQRMLANDSRECRACHDAQAMDTVRQNSHAASKHEQAERDHQTCVECHKGIAHTMPAEPVIANTANPATSPTEPHGPIVLDDLTLQPIQPDSPLPPPPVPPAATNLDRTFVMASQCFGCHGVDGISAGPATPSIAGLPHDSLRDSMRDMRSGKQPSTIMGRLLTGLSDADIDALANYFSRLPDLRPAQIADPE